jgi:tRNA modification GTPase
VAATPNNDTIAAPATAPGEGAIGIIRLSGPRAIPIADSLFHSPRGRRLNRGRGVYYGLIHGEDGHPIDEVLVNVMPAPHSYTRQDVAEINVHGGPAPLQAVLELLLRRGARLAQPGEFTKRAFLNGRIDLVQAEAVIDRIRAQTRAGLRAAASSAEGTLSRNLREITAALQDALARIEAAVDFPEDDLPELVDAALRARIEQSRQRMHALLETAEAGRLLREGVTIAIAGRPNAGKSSLFNALLRDARAIVTATPGTTRDVLEETISLGGVPARLVDTAGLREARDEVERLGVERARQALQTADAVLFVIDASQALHEEDEALADQLEALDVPVAVALNKIDLGAAQTDPWPSRFSAVRTVSALQDTGLHELEQSLGALVLGGAGLDSRQALLTRAHQRDSLRRAAEAVDRLLANFAASPEFLSIDLREALAALGEITGETTPEHILDRIFSEFCIGK